MDGYTFMIERNRRLIRHEAERRNVEERTGSPKDLEVLEGKLSADLQRLYRELEGCGRTAARGGSGDEK